MERRQQVKKILLFFSFLLKICDEMMRPAQYSQRWLVDILRINKYDVLCRENDVDYRLARRGGLGQERHPGPPNSLPAVEAGRLAVEPPDSSPLAGLACTSPAGCMLAQPTAMQSSDERQRDSPVLTGGLIRVWPTEAREVLGAAWETFCDLLRPAERRSSVWPFWLRHLCRPSLS